MLTWLTEHMNSETAPFQPLFYGETFIGLLRFVFASSPVNHFTLVTLLNHLHIK